MSMEWQVTDLQTSKKLRDLGVRQDKSNFYWVTNQFGTYLTYIDNNFNDPSIAAFTLAELYYIMQTKFTSLIDCDWIETGIKYSQETILNKIKLGILNVNQINERLGEL